MLGRKVEGKSCPQYLYQLKLQLCEIFIQGHNFGHLDFSAFQINGDTKSGGQCREIEIENVIKTHGIKQKEKQ